MKKHKGGIENETEEISTQSTTEVIPETEISNAVPEEKSEISQTEVATTISLEIDDSNGASSSVEQTDSKNGEPQPLSQAVSEPTTVQETSELEQPSQAVSEPATVQVVPEQQPAPETNTKFAVNAKNGYVLSRYRVPSGILPGAWTSLRRKRSFMKLSNLKRYDHIVIQMHDNPDADDVGSGYALYVYFQSLGKNVRLIYGGQTKITKSNICMLIKELDIPVEYIRDDSELKTPEYDRPQLLLTVDCQYGEGNVWHFDAEHVAMIDHHSTGRKSDDMSEIRSHIVSCSTVCYDMLRHEGYDVNENIAVATALYYGLFMDSNEFSEIRNPLERDMIDYLRIDKRLINRMTHANLTMQELETAAIAMIRFSYNEHKRLSIVKAKPCDPNILGLVGDMVLQVDSIDVCIIFNECDGGYKLSVRSCQAEVTANELAAYLTAGIGNGGGHTDKAGGFINQKKYEDKYEDMVIESYIFNRVEQYYDSFDVIYAKDGIADRTGFAPCKKKPYTYGYVRTTDLFEAGTECRVRTYEGDLLVTAEDDTYLLIGFFGEVYPIEKEEFDKKYTPLDEKLVKKFDYVPSVRSLRQDTAYELMPWARQCLSTGGEVYARLLEKPTKVFSRWNYDSYMYGVEGDYICYPNEDEKDIYIVKKEVFEETYEAV